MELVLISGHSLSAIDDAIIQLLETAILEDFYVLERQLVHEVKISEGSVKKIIRDHMHMGKVSAQWILQWLKLLQKQEWVKCAKALLTM